MFMIVYSMNIAQWEMGVKEIGIYLNLSPIDCLAWVTGTLHWLTELSWLINILAWVNDWLNCQVSYSVVCQMQPTPQPMKSVKFLYSRLLFGQPLAVELVLYTVKTLYKQLFARQKIGCGRPAPNSSQNFILNIFCWRRAKGDAEENILPGLRSGNERPMGPLPLSLNVTLALRDKGNWCFVVEELRRWPTIQWVLNLGL